MSRYPISVLDEYERPVPGVSIYVYKWDADAKVAGDLETLTDDLSAPLINPLISDADGLAYFNSVDGQKLLEYHYGGKVQFRELILVGAVFGAVFSTAVADSTITIGQLVNLYVTGGLTHMRLADGSVSDKPAHAFCVQTVASGATGSWCRRGIVPGTSATAFAADLWLSQTVPGAWQTAAPATTAGMISQHIGMVLPAVGVEFIPQPEIVL